MERFGDNLFGFRSLAKFNSMSRERMVSKTATLCVSLFTDFAEVLLFFRRFVAAGVGFVVVRVEVVDGREL